MRRPGAPTRSSSPPAHRAGWAASTSWRHDLAGRPLLAWSIAAIAASREVERIVVVTARPTGSTGLASRRLAAGKGRRRRRRAATGARSRSRPGSRRSTALDGERERPRVVLVHDGARPLAHAGARRARSRRRPRSTAPRSRSLPVAETLKRVDGDVDRRDRRPRGPGRGPDAAGRPASLLRSAFARFPPERTAGLDRRGRAARGLYHSGPCRPRRTGEPQGDRARGPRAGRAPSLRRAGGAAASRAIGRLRVRQPSVRAGRAARARRHRDRRRAAARTATPTATSRSTRSPTRCSARRGLGDLGRLFPADARDAARHRQPRARSRRSSRDSRTRPRGRRAST